MKIEIRAHKMTYCFRLVAWLSVLVEKGASVGH